MKKIVIIISLFIICILIYIGKEKVNNINVDINIKSSEIGIIFIKTDISNHLLYKKNNTNVLIYLSGEKNIDSILNRININKIDYFINFNDNLNKFKINNIDNTLYIKLFNKNLCVYKQGRLDNCDYVYFLNETKKEYDINLALYNENINEEFENELYNNWVDMYKFKTNEINFASFTKDDYNIVKLPINN